MDSPLTPVASPSDSRIVVDCPQCHRTIWAGTRCHHGEPVLLKVTKKDDPALKEPGDELAEDEFGKGLRGGLSK